MKKAMIVLSGGQDSTTCLWWAKAFGYELHAITFFYGQKHEREIEYARKNAWNAGCLSHDVIDVSGMVGASALTDHKKDVNDTHERHTHLPASFTPGRNAVFLAIAASKAFERGCKHVITGVCQTDFSGYPDCRQEFITAMERAMTLALDERLIIHTPLMHLTKAETWKLAATLGIVDIIVNDTLTDYNGSTTMNPWGMGEENNPASILRAKGYREALEKGWLQ